MNNFDVLSSLLGGKIKAQNLLNINFEEISNREILVKNYKGFKINIDEFGDLYQIRIDVESDLIFSINQPEKIFKISQLLELSDFPYDIYILEDQYSPFLNPDFELFWGLFSSKVKEINLSKKEFIFIDGYTISLIFESNRAAVPILDSFIHLIKTNEALFTTKSRQRILKKNIPDNLKSLFPLLKKWSISDDDLREQLIEEASDEQKKKLIYRVSPYMDDINDFLNSFQDQPLSEEAILIQNLAELVSELAVYQKGG